MKTSKNLSLWRIHQARSDAKLAQIAYNSKFIRRPDQGMTGIGYNYKKGWNGIRTDPYAPLVFDDI